MDSGSSSRTSSAIERSDTPHSRQNAKSGEHFGILNIWYLITYCKCIILVETQSGRLPELVIKCQRCNEYLYVHLWPHHRSVHRALDLFGYAGKI